MPSAGWVMHSGAYRMPPSAATLLAGETQGLAIDATQSGGSVLVIDTGTPANNKNSVPFAAAPNLVQSGSSSKVVQWNDGVLRTVGVGVVAQEYDTSRGAFGILIEPAATNLVTRSAELDAAPWSIVGSNITSVTANSQTAPDGTATAELITEDTATNNHVVYQLSITITSGSTYSFSAYLKAGTRRYVSLKMGTANNYITAIWDLSAGTLGETSVGATSGTIIGTNIQALASGWYRCTVIGSVNVSSTNIAIGGAGAASGNSFTSSGDPTYTGTSSTWAAWGVQLELGASSSSYIATAGATSTRNADVISLAASSFPWSDTNGSIYFDFKLLRAAAPVPVMWQAFKDTNNSISLVVQPPNNQMTNKGGGVFDVTSALGTQNTSRTQVSIAFAANDFDGSMDGAVVVSDGTAAITTGYSTLYLGTNAAGGSEMNGYIYRLVYVPRQVQTASGNLVGWRYNY